MSLPSAAELVRAFGPAKKVLGQNFLTDPSILQRLVDAADLEPGSPVIEIGPGPGGLTRTLLAAGHPVTAVDIDRRVLDHLTTRLVHPALKVVEADALRVETAPLFEGGDRAVMGNLPYNVATEIFFKFERLPHVSRMLFMFQREVANRFVAGVGSKPYGLLALMSGIRWRPTLAVKLPPGAFRPRPKVHSAAVRFDLLAEPSISSELEATFREVVRSAFQQRRKTIRNSLRPLGVDFEAAGVDPGLRPERIDRDGFRCLAETARTSP